MRISGLATGMDTESIINDLMKVEKMPLDKMEQDKTKMEWQRDKFREINTLRQKIDDMAFDLQLSKTFNTKTVNSSQENAVTATGSPTSSEGAYKIEVTKLATSYINVSDKITDTDLSKKVGNTFSLKTFNDNDNDPTNEFEYTIEQGDTLDDLIKKINEADINVRMFYDENTNQVIMETTRTGKYNNDTNEGNGKEIVFDEKFAEIFKMGHDSSKERDATNATFKYNDAYTVTSKENNYTLNGINFEFKNTTEGPATITLTNDIDTTVDRIKEFVEKYNELIDMMNQTQREEKYRDFPPLTEEQKKELEEREIELWEEKAKSGILRGDSIITSTMTNLRQNWYQSVDTGGTYNVITQIGLTTTKDYLDGGKIEINEDKLREALQTDPDSVHKLFAGNGDGKGIMDHIDDSLETLKTQIHERAGRSSDTLSNYTLGKRIKDIDNRMDVFQDRLQQIETRYWRQFTAMEKAISTMNNQSAMLMNNFFQ
ncbi:flagellar hook-associated protein 2 [Oceanobacillus sp. Castelsardo]|uniref:flagellar hook-associated protein 2 n=1 Tax=Oceanobacillus sp. Castelsardo TaxID=1851204 RepID=UPI000837E1DC|nr:flagellar hook-associated protein 2 [Oceanobacillus sp. Castelsardo]